MILMSMAARLARSSPNSLIIFAAVEPVRAPVCKFLDQRGSAMLVMPPVVIRKESFPYAPDPRTLTPEQALTAYDQANYIWFYFAAIGLVSALALYAYTAVTRRIDARRNQASGSRRFDHA
jgi:hypothetical protein